MPGPARNIATGVVGAVIGASATFFAADTDTTRHEGGAVHHVDDLGGRTGNKGLTEDLFRKYEDDPRIGYEGTFEEVPDSVRLGIAYLEFWQPLGLDYVADSLGYEDAAWQIYDLAYNAGTGRAARYFQSCVGTTADGIVGSGTLAALDAYSATYGPLGDEKLQECIVEEQRYHYINIAAAREANETFLYGWLARVTPISPDIDLHGQVCLNLLNNKGRLYGGDFAMDGKAGAVTKEALGRYVAHRGFAGVEMLHSCLESLE